jgi:hypothetical protein
LAQHLKLICGEDVLRHGLPPLYETPLKLCTADARNG